MFRSYNLYIIFREPSRITKISKTCIDNIFTNMDNGDGIAETINPHISEHTKQTYIK